VASARGSVVARVEGGLWHNPGFEARTDFIWDGADPPVDLAAAARNNGDAAEFVREESASHNCFIVTAPSIDGWPHQRLETGITHLPSASTGQTEKTSFTRLRLRPTTDSLLDTDSEDQRRPPLSTSELTNP